MAKLRLTYPTFCLPPVTSGAGALKTVADLRLAGAAFMVSGQSAVGSLLSDALAGVAAMLPSDRILQKPPGEPTRETIEVGAAFLGALSPSTIVAVGGGSVMDWARLSWARSVDVLNLDRGLIAQELVASRPAFVLVPTTCASGAEGATVAVYSDRGVKRAVVSPSFLAQRVILDGRFLRFLDQASFSASVADALSHSLESILSIVPNGLAKMAAGAALRTLLDLGGGDVPTASRADRLLEASYLAGGAASHTSVGIAHAFAHAMAREGTSHGRGNAVAIVAALRFNETAPSMTALLLQAGCGYAALLDRVRAIVAPAVSAEAAQVTAVLSDTSRRHALVAGMLADTALRSNPLPADEEAVHRFLDLVGPELVA